MLSSATRWRISGVAGLLFVVISVVASAINVQPPPYTYEHAGAAGGRLSVQLSRLCMVSTIGVADSGSA